MESPSGPSTTRRWPTSVTHRAASSRECATRWRPRTSCPPAPLSDVRLIDVKHLGRERVIGCWQVDDVLIDPGPGSCLPTLLDALGDEPPRALLLTHIHLDHAGASGSLVEPWPHLGGYGHERGPPHL